MLASASIGVAQEEDAEASAENASETEPAFRQAVPTEETLEAARKVIGEVYRDLYANAKSDEQRIALANRLIEDALVTEDDEAGRFMMLRIARDIAVGAGDPETAFRAVDALAERFAVEPRALKAEALTRMRGAPKLPVYTKDYVENLGLLYDEAVSVDDYAQARVFAEAAVRMSRKVDDLELRKEIAARTRRIDALEQAFADVKPAQEKLEQDPFDQAANETLGRYLCFVKGDWTNGIPMLALGGETELRTLARQEVLLDESDSAAVVELADQWWQLAEATNDADEKLAMQQRAADWYEQAIPQLTGLSQAKAQRRLDEIRGEE